MPRKHEDFGSCHSAALGCHSEVTDCILMPYTKIICSLMVKDGTNEYQATELKKQTKGHRDILPYWPEY